MKAQEEKLQEYEADHSYPGMESNRLSPWYKAIATKFVEPQSLRITEDGYIHIVVLLKNITNPDQAGFKLRVNFSRWLNSIVTHTNK